MLSDLLKNKKKKPLREELLRAVGSGIASSVPKCPAAPSSAKKQKNKIKKKQGTAFSASSLLVPGLWLSAAAAS